MKENFYKRDNFLNDGCQFVSQEKLSGYINSLKYNCGILSKNGFHFNPFEFLNALKSQLVKKPGRIFENSKMVGFHETDDGCKVQLQNGLSIYAKKLILTTGGYGGQETGFLRSRWLPISTFIATTKSLGENLEESLVSNLAFSDDRRAGNYYRMISGKRLLWGRGVSAMPLPTRRELEKLVRTDIKFFLPDLIDKIGGIEKLEFDCVWSGKMAYSFNMMPYVGKVTERVYASMGFGGHGMNTAPASAIVLAEFLLGISDRVSIFKNILFSWNGSRLGPHVAEGVCQIMNAWDKLNSYLAKNF